MSAPTPPMPTPGTPGASPALSPTPANSGGGGAWSVQALRGLVVAEVRKTLSTSIWWALLIPAAVLCLLVNLATALGEGIAYAPAVGMSFALGSISSKFAAVYGVICATGEFRHRTITTSYLTAAGRTQLISAKVLVAAAVGVVYAIGSVAFGLLGVLLGGGSLAGADLTGGFGGGGGVVGPLLAVCAVSLLTFALWAALGVGVGTLIGNQLATIVGVLVYVLLVEQIIVVLASLGGLGQLEPYLPDGSAGATLKSLVGDSPLSGILGTSGLPWWLTLIIFAGYSAIAVLAGAAMSQHRDIT